MTPIVEGKETEADRRLRAEWSIALGIAASMQEGLSSTLAQMKVMCPMTHLELFALETIQEELTSAASRAAYLADVVAGKR